MPHIVLVHGIGQTQQSADTLETEWLPALAGGIRLAGDPVLADRLTNRPATGGIEVRMAFYGNQFLHPDAQGPAGTSNPPDLQELAHAYAINILRTAEQHAPDARDRYDAAREMRALDEAHNPRPDAQGSRSRARRPLTVASKLRWFGPMAIKVGAHTIQPALMEAVRYLADSGIRAAAQQQVLDLVNHDTRLVIGHSLGSVVAYEALHQLPEGHQPLHLITLGSPLGMHGVFYEKLQPQPACVPTAAASWHNFASPDDLVALTLDLAPLYPAAAVGGATITTKGNLDTGAEPHSAVHYLTKRSVGAAAARALQA